MEMARDGDCRQRGAAKRFHHSVGSDGTGKTALEFFQRLAVEVDWPSAERHQQLSGRRVVGNHTRRNQEGLVARSQFERRRRWPILAQGWSVSDNPGIRKKDGQTLKGFLARQTISGLQ